MEYIVLMAYSKTELVLMAVSLVGLVVLLSAWGDQWQKGEVRKKKEEEERKKEEERKFPDNVLEQQAEHKEMEIDEEEIEVLDGNDNSGSTKNCSDCGGMVSKRAASCPHCGCPSTFHAPTQKNDSKPTQTKTTAIVVLCILGLVVMIVGYQEQKRRWNATTTEANESVQQSAEKSRKLMIKSDLLSELVNSHERLVLYHKDQRSRPIEIKQAVDNLKEKITGCVEGGSLTSQKADQYRKLMAAEQFTEAYKLLAIALVKIADEMGVFDDGK